MAEVQGKFTVKDCQLVLSDETDEYQERIPVYYDDRIFPQRLLCQFSNSVK
jgi:hypothetical protein